MLEKSQQSKNCMPSPLFTISAAIARKAGRRTPISGSEASGISFFEKSRYTSSALIFSSFFISSIILSLPEIKKYHSANLDIRY